MCLFGSCLRKEFCLFSCLFCCWHTGCNGPVTFDSGKIPTGFTALSNPTSSAVKWQTANKAVGGLYTGPKSDHTSGKGLLFTIHSYTLSGCLLFDILCTISYVMRSMYSQWIVDCFVCWSNVLFCHSLLLWSPGKGYFAYIDASIKHNANDRAILISPILPAPTASNCYLTFFYHMFGSQIGSLSVQLKQPTGTVITTWSVKGNQGDLWKSKVLAVPNTAGHYQVNFISGFSMRIVKQSAGLCIYPEGAETFPHPHCCLWILHGPVCVYSAVAILSLYLSCLLPSLSSLCVRFSFSFLQAYSFVLFIDWIHGSCACRHLWRHCNWWHLVQFFLLRQCSPWVASFSACDTTQAVSSGPLKDKYCPVEMVVGLWSDWIFVKQHNICELY